MTVEWKLKEVALLRQAGVGLVFLVAAVSRREGAERSEAPGGGYAVPPLRIKNVIFFLFFFRRIKAGIMAAKGCKL